MRRQIARLFITTEGYIGVVRGEIQCDGLPTSIVILVLVGLHGRE